jgi:glycosyltransferase involved in cell wall biosynthesis
LNICIITSWFPNSKSPGRAPFVFQFARNLAKLGGVNVSVITPLEEGEDWQEQPVSKQDSVTIYRVRERIFPLLSILRFVNQIKPDIIHVHAPNFFSSNAILVAQLAKIPIIATVHRVEVDAIDNPLLSHFRKYVLRRFQKIIAVSNFTKSLALKAGAEENKISVIYNSCDEELFLRRNDDKFSLRKKYNLPADKKIILFVGNLVKHKGVYILIESLKQLQLHFPNFVAMIIGQGEEYEKLYSIAKQYNLTDNVRFLGWLPQRELYDFYNTADVFVNPSTIEAHSVALLEAMACGLPIVASNTGGNKESVKDGINGLLFQSGSENDLTEKLAKLLTNSELQQRLSVDSPKIYAEKFSTRTQIEDHLMLYSRLINKESEDKTQTTTRNCSSVLLIDNYKSEYTSYLACGLAKYKDVILYGYSRDSYTISGAAKEKGIRFFCIDEKMPKNNSLISIIVVRPFILFFILFKALIKTNYNIVHIQGHLPLFFLFLPMLKLRAKKIYWTLHDVKLRPSSKGLRGKLEVLYVRIIAQSKLLRKYADIIIVHGSLLKDQLVSNGVDPKKICVIPHPDYRYLMSLEPKDSNIDASANNSSYQEQDLYNDYFLFFGMIKPYKGLDVLINAAKIVNARMKRNNNSGSNASFSLLICGVGDISVVKDLLAKEDYEYIHIRNKWIPIHEVPALISKSRCLLLPYTDASQSGVVPLAYTFSKPVIVSNVGSMAEYVEHNRTGFIIESGNSVQLAEYIIQLIEDNSKCIEMGRNAYQKMLHEMSLERCCDIINDLYEQV